MPPKKATGTATKKASAPADHPPYKDMIKDAIIVLKERNGSSRQAIKKYVLNNNKGIKVTNFDTQFNAAIKRGVLAGDFVQPKGPSGPVKLQKKDASKATAKSTTDKPAKKPTVKKPAAPKKAPGAKVTKPKAAAKPKTAVANSKKPRKTTSTTEKPATSKTKTGRVTKAKAPTTKKVPANKKAAPKKKAAEPSTATAE